MGILLEMCDLEIQHELAVAATSFWAQLFGQEDGMA